MPNPTATIVTITPEVAAEWLQANTHNRPVRKTVVNAQSRDIKSGNWQLNGETIKFDVNGRLRDGQHRLESVVASGKSIQSFVVWDLAPEVQETVDTGIARTAADAAGLRGVKNSALQAAAARIGILLASEGNNMNGKVTHSEILQFIEDNPDLEDAARHASETRKSVQGCRPSLLAYAYFVLNRVDKAANEDFWHATANLVPSYLGDPAVALAKRFADLYVHRQQVTDLETLALIYRSWNKRRNLQAAKLIRVQPVRSAAELPTPK